MSFNSLQTGKPFQTEVLRHWTKETMSFNSLQTGKPFQTSDHRFVAHRYTSYGCFNSLQTGKPFQTDVPTGLTKKVEELFQFPSNGKALSDTIPESHVVETSVFQFPSNGKALSDASMILEVNMDNRFQFPSNGKALSDPNLKRSRKSIHKVSIPFKRESPFRPFHTRGQHAR